MSLLKLKEQGLAVLLLFVFTACDKLLPTSGNGELVPVKIRSVSVKGYGDASATRSGGGEKRIVGQPIVQDLGGGMLAEITVEEDVSALRATQRLDNGAKFRIVALKKNTSEIYSWADYTAASSGTLEPIAGNLHVVSEVEYDFVCFSYNSTTANWPAALSEGATLGSIAVTNANDFLYKKLTASLSAASNTLDLTLEQQFTKVTLILDAGSRTITNVANTIKILSVSTPTTFNLAATTNALSGTASGDVSFTSWGSTANTIQQDLLRLLPKSGTSTLNLPAEAITVGDTWKSEAKTISLPALAVGSSYTIRLTLVKLPKFAGSNIYWDNSDQDVSKHKLTFVAHGEGSGTNATYYQGVFFKWGSLIGISPARTNGSDDFSSGTTTNKGQNDGTSIYLKVNGEWKKTNVAYATSEDKDKDNGKERWFGSSSVSDNTTGEDAWSPIPSYDGTDISESALVGHDAHTLLAKSDFEHYKGDICNYINPAYRMPTRNELIALYNSDADNYYTGFTSSSITNQTADGTTAFTSTFGTFTGLKAATNITYYLPASGYRYYSSGALNYVGYYGYYWSGSASSGTNGATSYPYFHSSGYAYTNYTFRSNGFPVRCVLNE